MVGIWKCCQDFEVLIQNLPLKTFRGSSEVKFISSDGLLLYAFDA